MVGSGDGGARRVGIVNKEFNLAFPCKLKWFADLDYHTATTAAELKILHLLNAGVHRKLHKLTELKVSGRGLPSGQRRWI